MKKLLSIFLCMICLYAQAQVTTGTYQVYRGNVMGAETVIHLHIAKAQAMGFIYLIKDPRPFFTYAAEIKGDSIFLSGGRSMQTSMEISGTISKGMIKGTARLTLEEKLIRSGAATLQLDTTHYTSFDFFSASASAGLPAAMKNESKYDQSSATVWPKATDKTVLATYVQKQGLTFLDQKTPGDPAQFLSASQQKNIKAWKASMAKAYPKGAADMGLSLSSSIDRRYMVLNENNTCINFIQYNEEYSGGAHSNANSEIQVIDKRTNKVLQLTDILTPAGIKALSPLLEKAARSQFGIAANAPLDSRLLVKNIQPAKQFFMDDAGIGFWYNAYEVASYADGHVILFIPLALIAKYIQPSFLKK